VTVRQKNQYVRARLAEMAGHVHKAISYSLNAGINLLVPPRCGNCNRISVHQAGLCAICWPQIRFIEQPFCEVMGTPFSLNLGDATLSTEAIANPPPFARLRSAVIYDDIARRLISRFKFSDRNDLAPFIANAMVRAGGSLLEDADIIIPLPLHWRRLHSRRFNQSADLARIISVVSASDNKSIPTKPMVLTRTRNTKQQIGLTQEGRHRNVSGAFLVPADKAIQITGKRVLLIDDVYTSGASVKSATKALLRGGAEAVDVLTFARVHSGII
jgi:ComF family protein